jgi:hypothetical protein
MKEKEKAAKDENSAPACPVFRRMREERKWKK